MNNALWSPRGAQARERTHTAGYTVASFENDAGLVINGTGERKK
jgi:hypothetical protein